MPTKYPSNTITCNPRLNMLKTRQNTMNTQIVMLTVEHQHDHDDQH